MLNGIETIFDNTTQMLRHLKKKSFEKNTQDFIDSYGHYFREMTEYVMRNVNKARAEKKLMSLLGISEENVIAFGDGENDLELFKSSGTACAVSSAPPKIKKEADITADFNEETLKKFILK